MRLSVDHTTHYTFSEPVSHGLQRLRLLPKTSAGQQVVAWDMHFEGARLQVEYEDQNCNHVSLISFETGVREVTIRCTGVVDTNDEAGIIGRHSGHMPMWQFLEQTDLTRVGPRTRSLVAAVAQDDAMVGRLHSLSALVCERVSYATGHTDAGSTAENVLAAGAGVCQDHAHVFIAAARAMGVPARYVSGYLMMDDRVQQDAGHAWAEAFVDGLGWVGFDISNGISPDARYVRVATGRDYREAAPITGIRYGTHDESMRVSLAVEQQHMEQ